MKNALIVGGANGIGLSMALNLVNYNKIYVLDIERPKIDLPDNIEYVYFNLLENPFSDLNKFQEINTLFISAGIGKLELFKDSNEKYIDDIFRINAIGPIKIVKKFIDQLNSTEKDFYCGIMVSIAGWLASPFFSLYSSTKAALHMFIEALNSELDRNGSNNRITEISPGKIDGTSFYGGETDLESLKDLTVSIIENIFGKRLLYIPSYDTVFKNVIERYNLDHHKFGLESYDYKNNRKK